MVSRGIQGNLTESKKRKCTIIAELRNMHTVWKRTLERLPPREEEKYGEKIEFAVASCRLSERVGIDLLKA